MLMRIPLVLVLTLAILTGCTAQQWQTTKNALALTALVGIAVIASTPSPVTTTCKTVAHRDTVQTVCTTY